MTHRIELTVTCDQPDLDRLAALIAKWSAETAERDQHGLNSQVRAGRQAMHQFLIDGKPWGSA